MQKKKIDSKVEQKHNGLVKSQPISKKKKLLKVLKIGSLVTLVFVFLITGILLLVPYWPEIKYKLNPPPKDIDLVERLEIDPLSLEKLKNGAQVDPVVVSQETVSNPSPEKVYTLEGNKLVIPSIGLITPILEGSDISVLDAQYGVWRDPFGTNTTPDQQGNLVLAGHRFQYLGPNTETFYHLNLVNIGDRILIKYNNVEYVYQVFDKKEVSPRDYSVRNASADHPYMLTIYTCTTMNTDDNRLVLQAYRL
jgi:LPXTG-site transpeptidase (sortase) family protein